MADEDRTLHERATSALIKDAIKIAGDLLSKAKTEEERQEIKKRLSSYVDSMNANFVNKN